MVALTFKVFYDHMLDALDWKSKGKTLNDKQKEAVRFGIGPLWIIAGPGSGKTEVLVWRILKLILVDNINPKSIIVTTFTEKAGRNLADRIAQYIDCLIDKKIISFETINLADLRVGTLHSICNNVLQEYRYEAVDNKKLMNEVEQAYFVHKFSEMRKIRNDKFWNFFKKNQKKIGSWHKTKLTLTIFNRITEDLIDVNKLLKSNNSTLRTTAKHYLHYLKRLEEQMLYDFATVQKKFLEFLDCSQGQLFLNGGEEQEAIRYVLVDEYQDTNPIQELIYFRLAGGHENPLLHKSMNLKNLTIVGDDDQALYRFRGGTVELLVDFKNSCNRFLDLKPYFIQLIENYRSHPKIVDWFNEYIKNHPDIAGARAPGKKDMIASNNSPRGNYQPILVIAGDTHEETAEKVGNIIKWLKDNHKVKDDSQIVLLFRSTKETDNFAGPYVNKLRELGNDIYNPRSKKVQKFFQIQELIGAIIEIIDPTLNRSGPPGGTVFDSLTLISEQLKKFILSCKACFLALYNSNSYNELNRYVDDSINRIRGLKGEIWIKSTLQEILYKLLNLEPFISRLTNPDWAPRYSIITNLLEGYCSIYSGHLIRANNRLYLINENYTSNFYYSFCGLIVSMGLNDYEDQDMPIPKGYIQVMTYHQAKGLEFPYVFLGSLSDSLEWGNEHKIEEKFNPYRQFPSIITSSKEIRALRDGIRRFYMGISRPQIGLILFTHNKYGCVNSFGYDKNGQKRYTKEFLDSKGIFII